MNKNKIEKKKEKNKAQLEAFRAQYYLWLQASMEGLGTHLPRLREDYCTFTILKASKSLIPTYARTEKPWTYADVIALYRSCPAVSHICAFIVFPSTWMLLVANSTPMVLLLSRLNSFRVNRDRRLLFPTPESPIRTTEKTKKKKKKLDEGKHIQITNMLLIKGHLSSK